MSITRPSTMSQEDLDRFMEKLARHGASVKIDDARVTSFQTWVLATIGITLVGVGGWGIKSINDLNQTMTVVVTQNAYRDKQLQRVEDHVEILDGRVVILERKVR